MGVIKKLELLAPAKNAQIAIEAIKHGADAVYMGANRYGARAMAGNSIDDIKQVVEFAHKFNARVYVTVNTILFDDELPEVEKLIRQLYIIGVDALIVQDMGILRLDIPPIPLHASTQCDIRDKDKASFLEKVGFSQIVLARELTLNEIKEISNAVSVPLESFIHGALCVSYSGRCGVSQACMKRSANRGMCSQMCRLPYRIEDEEGNVLAEEKHYLSLKDLNRSASMKDLIEAGVTSFKIEGRLKDIGYVKNVVAYYRQIIDDIIAENPGKYERSSCGKSVIQFEPCLEKVFNRSFTSYFLYDRYHENGTSIASIHTPKSMGEFIGAITSVRNGNILQIDTNHELVNGDGLSYFIDGAYTGFRVNKVQGKNVFISNKVKLPKGTRLYRTFDKKMNDILDAETSRRNISVDMNLEVSKSNNVVSLEIKDERGNYVVSSKFLETPLELAKTLQSQKQEDILKKLGSTIYVANNVTTKGELFIPSSLLADLRREAIEKLDCAQKVNYKYDTRMKEDEDILFYRKHLSHTDNVSNRLSAMFYKSHGVETVSNAIECNDYIVNGSDVLMHTRYCILRELGWCRKSGAEKNIPNKIFLVNNKTKLIVETDCKNCEMKIRKSYE